jgi:hypothetical protein
MYAALPASIKTAAREAYRLFLRNPAAESLAHHELSKTRRGNHRDGSFAVSITRRYRAVYVTDGDTNVWYWIGSHSDYNRLTGHK